MDYLPESPYERMRPLRESFDKRLHTFNNWHHTSVNPLDLVRDYFYYLGIDDKCQCTQCGGVLGGWSLGDNVHREHRKHFPDCPFIQQCLQNPEPINPPQGYVSQGYNFGAQNPEQSVPMETSQTPADKPGVTRPKYREYALEQTRLASFTGWPTQMKQKPDALAQSGFFYLGQGDKVKCFYCGGILWDWDPSDEPNTEHAKWFPKCPWLSLSKGDAFVEKVQKDMMNMTMNPSQPEETAVKVVEDTQPKIVSGTQPSSSSTATGPASSKNYSTESHLNETEKINLQEVIEENRRIKEEKQCKICMDADVSVVFFPCGHLACCPKCAVPLEICPICRKPIEKQVKIYW